MRLQFFFVLFCCVGLAACSAPMLDLTQTPTETTRAQFEAFVAQNAPSEDAFVAVQRLAYGAIERKNWAEAIEIFRQYKPAFPDMQARFDVIINILNTPGELISVSNLGDSIINNSDDSNTAPAPSILPVIIPDGNTLYFTTQHPYTGEDVMSTTLVNGKWTKAAMLPPPIMTVHSESVTGISPDGNRLLLFGNYPGGPLRGNIYYSDKDTDGSWSAVKPFPEPINSDYFDGDGKLTSDGKAMLFVSDRPGGIGGYHPKVSANDPDAKSYHGSNWGNTDIYVSLKQSDGSWGPAINLGPTINTPYAERSPFLHPDGKTLYFASEGHAGLGFLDIYKCTRLSEGSWTEWSEPVNLGREVNTAEDDWGYVASTDGQRAYMSMPRNKNGNVGGAIFSMNLPQAAKPAQVATVMGLVTDENGKPLSASIKWEDLETGADVGELSSDPKEGDYFITLPLHKNYGYHAEKVGYFPVSRHIDLRNQDTATHLSENIVLMSVKSMQQNEVSVNLNNIFFDRNEANLRSESYPELQRLIDILKQAPGTRVEIAAYTDNTGSHQHNLELSKQRAEAVVAYLVSKGSDTTTLIPMGYSEAKPIATNETEEGRAMNRRVEFKFLKDAAGVMPAKESLKAAE
jgi:outer membrane protein OmpA-like peptidoglycan-associated protein